ncbi:transposase [Alkalibacillus haloalkaliphilus]
MKQSEIPDFNQGVKALQNWQKEIMNSFGYKIHNG